MTSLLAGGAVNIVGQGAALANTPGLLSELTGQSKRVQFLRPGLGVIFVFDSCINESHVREATPSMFPIESGGLISDNLNIAPFEISLTGVVSDTPIYHAEERLQQTFGDAATTLVPPLGIAIAAGAQRAYKLSQGASSRSKDAYQTLVSIQAGNPLATPPQLPEPFTVVTQYKRYTNVIIKSLKFDRDASTATTCVFSMTLVQLRRIAPQSVRLSILKNPGIAAQKQDAGEADPNDIAGSYDAGKAAGDKRAGQVVDSVKAVGRMLNIGQG